MARAAATIVRGEDWAILAVCLFGAGMALRRAKLDGDLSITSPLQCALHPIQCGRDTAQRVRVRLFFTFGLYAVGVTVALRRWFPQYSGLPYAALLVILGQLMLSGGLDSFLSTLDLRGVLDELRGDPPATPRQPTRTTTTTTTQVITRCHDPAAICHNRGGVVGVYAGPNCGTVACGDRNVYSRATGQVVVAAPTPCKTAAQLCAGRSGRFREFDNPGTCGYVQCNNGQVLDKGTGTIVAPGVWDRMKDTMRPW